MMDILLFNKLEKLDEKLQLLGEEIIKTEKKLLEKGWQRGKIIYSCRSGNEFYEYTIEDTLNTDLIIYESQEAPFKKPNDEIWFRYKNYKNSIVQTYIISQYYTFKKKR